MLFLVDEPPKFCPYCGTAQGGFSDHLGRQDFFAGCSSQCRCGAMYQYVPRPQLLEGARLHPQGDLPRYAES